MTTSISSEAPQVFKKIYGLNDRLTDKIFTEMMLRGNYAQEKILISDGENRVSS